MANEDELLTTAEVAKLLKVSPGCVKTARTRGTNTGSIPPIPYLKLGRNIRYRRADVENLINGCLVVHPGELQ